VKADVARVRGATLVGTGAELVTVEARFEAADRERTEVALTGLPDPVLRESRGKLLPALRSAGLAPPPGRLHLNLVPAGLRKRGEILDLALALGAVAACGHLEPRELGGALFLGELGLDGALHAVPGGLAAADAARTDGVRRVVAPPATAREACHLPGVEVWEADSLTDALAQLTGARPPRRLTPREDTEPRRDGRGAALARVRGQEAAGRALAVAAAGGHALLLTGPPGVGKSLLARALPGLLPSPCVEERVEITRVLSAAGRWPGGLATERPFRAPHHSASHAGLVGGGSPPGPGEVTLAHRGVLFLDELPEFRRETLEALRQPLEDGRVRIVRASSTLDLPARFQLVCAMNPCPCGHLGDPRRACRCAPGVIARYRARVSGPLLDRIDLRVELGVPGAAALSAGTSDRRTAEVRALVEAVDAAHGRAVRRQGAVPNAQLPPGELERLAPLGAGATDLLERAARRRALSARGVASLRRIARTLADLEGAERPGPEHLAEALALRAPLLE
jgi:magnesium chelatase family protein